jgi:hypothetical protein
MEIAAFTLLRPRPAKEGSERDYLSPESTGGHELGHTGGLEHWFGKTPNLMQEGLTREFDNKTITLDQIKQIHTGFVEGRLNQGSSKIGSREAARER